jgi:hypothetical protein
MQGIVQLISRHSGAHTCLLQKQTRQITADFLTLSLLRLLTRRESGARRLELPHLDSDKSDNIITFVSSGVFV